MATQEELAAYLATLDRMEPDITKIDTGAAAASISISLHRIADALEMLAIKNFVPVEDGTAAGEELSNAVDGVIADFCYDIARNRGFVS